ncbi:DNA polymerase B region protein [Vibrio phage vB_VibM_83AMN]|nr:DNA polymerase B region protein [Vibrio phage vB_VibM_83AMN]
MRNDSLGIFWEDLPPPPKVKKEKVKRIPPDPVWLRPDYLPNLEIAKQRKFDLYTDAELMQAYRDGEWLEFDIECYPNYTLIGFTGFNSGKTLIFEQIDGVLQIDVAKLKWVMENFTTVGFNNHDFDNTLIKICMVDCSNATLKKATDMLIVEEMRSYDVLKYFKAQKRDLIRIKPYVDLMNVAPRMASLKKYSARLHIEQIQDLPINPNMWLTYDHMSIIRWYWGNDIKCNFVLHEALISEIELRKKIGEMYGGLNLMHRSDPQVAEDIFISEYKRITGLSFVKKPNVDAKKGTKFKYIPPSFIQFKTKLMQDVFKSICLADFEIQHNGYVRCDLLENLTFTINGTTYKMGIGGLHSQEKSRYYLAKNGWIVRDDDVTSYYPNLILNSGLFPEAFGHVFVSIYKDLKEMRVVAKATEKRLEKLHGDLVKSMEEYKDAKTMNGSGKIVINGSFGKLGNPTSRLYAPDLLIQTTVTGQLSLLMLIEELEQNGIHVISANTDGIVKYYREDQDDLLNHIIKQWEIQTGLEMEATFYKGIFSRDVNNYFAIKENGKIKGVGVFNEANLQLDPKYEICTIAAMEYLSKGIPIEKTVNSCNEMKNFVMLKQIKSGAVFDGEYLGKVVRYYKSNREDLPEMVASASGNLVPMSTNAVPCQLLPSSIPSDLDREWYIEESYKVLKGLGWEM